MIAADVDDRMLNAMRSLGVDKDQAQQCVSAELAAAEASEDRSTYDRHQARATFWIAAKAAL